MATQRPRRLLRISKACDFCHKRRIKCQDNPAGGNRCQNCAEFDIPCTYARPSRRGRSSPPPLPPSSSAVRLLPPPLPSFRDPGPQHNALQSHHPLMHRHHRARSGSSTVGTPTRNSSNHLKYASRHGSGGDGGDGGSSSDEGERESALITEPLSPTWKAFAHMVTPTLRRLFGIYHETVHPIFPLFDPVYVERRLDMLEHVRSRAFFCSVMAACALASARARDGALSTLGGPNIASTPSSQASHASSQASHAGGTTDIPPEVFLAAAEEALPRDPLQCQDFDYMRGCALLAIASIQDAKIASMQKYIGLYFTMMAISQWHDEANWPTGLNMAEIEERRRLYWSIYTLDVFSSIIWDGCIHFQESHARVEYPTGRTEPQTTAADGTTIKTSASVSPPTPSSPSGIGSAASASSAANAPLPNWMVGWNFTTDLYRILEHNLSKLRSRSSRFILLGEPVAGSAGDNNANANTKPSTSASLSGAPPGRSSQDLVASLYAQLPPIFKRLQPATGDPARDVYGFQTANIQATMALLQMVHLSLDADAAGLEQRCAVVHEVLQTFHRVPKTYQRAISTPLIYHIGGIGVILGSVMEGMLSEASYRVVRELLLSMAGLLEGLESFLHRSAGTGARLRSLVGRLEAYVTSQRTNNQAAAAAAAASSADTPSTTTTATSATLQHVSMPPPPPQSTAVACMQHMSPPMTSAAVGPGSMSHQQQQQQQQQQQHQHQHQQQQQQHQPQQQPQQPQQPQQQINLPSVPTAPVMPLTMAPSTAHNPTSSPPTGSATNVVPMPDAYQENMGGGWDVSQARAANLPPDMNLQFQLPDELLQGWTWPFAVSSNYLSF